VIATPYLVSVLCRTSSAVGWEFEFYSVLNSRIFKKNFKTNFYEIESKPLASFLISCRLSFYAKIKKIKDLTELQKMALWQLCHLFENDRFENNGQHEEGFCPCKNANKHDI